MECLDAVEQRKVNATNQKIADAIQRLSSKIFSLQRQLKDIQAMKSNRSEATNLRHLNIDSEPESRSNTSSNNDNNFSTYLMCLEEPPDELLSSLRLVDDQQNANETELSNRRKSLHRLMSVSLLNNKIY